MVYFIVYESWLSVVKLLLIVMNFVVGFKKNSREKRVGVIRSYV